MCASKMKDPSIEPIRVLGPIAIAQASPGLASMAILAKNSIRDSVSSVPLGVLPFGSPHGFVRMKLGRHVRLRQLLPAVAGRPGPDPTSHGAEARARACRWAATKQGFFRSGLEGFVCVCLLFFFLEGFLGKHGTPKGKSKQLGVPPQMKTQQS